MTDAESIIIEWLSRIGADGLCHEDSECGCGIDDLAPCDGIQKGCQPARLLAATEPGDCYEIGDFVYFKMG